MYLEEIFKIYVVSINLLKILQQRDGNTGPVRKNDKNIIPPIDEINDTKCNLISNIWQYWCRGS